MNWVELISAITALVTAVGGVIAVFRHVNGPKHVDPAPPSAPVLPSFPAPPPAPPAASK